MAQIKLSSPYLFLVDFIGFTSLNITQHNKFFNPLHSHDCIADTHTLFLINPKYTYFFFFFLSNFRADELLSSLIILVCVENTFFLTCSIFLWQLDVCWCLLDSQLSFPQVNLEPVIKLRMHTFSFAFNI